MTHVIATSRRVHERLIPMLEEATGEKFVLINSRDELNADRLREIAPRYVFFPHWSYIIPAEIFTAHECVIFHMTDVPFGRGGSPLQNLIARGIYETKLTALKCVAELDAGPVYLKEPLSLHGNADEIFMRASALIHRMIVEIVTNHPTPVEQVGEPVAFPRRKPAESDIAGLDSLTRVHDFIRMLDAEGYPKAFLEVGHLRLEFTRASLKPEEVFADVRITLRKP